MPNSVLPQNDLDDLSAIADDFATVAQKVNDSSHQRKKHTESAISFLEQADRAGSVLLKELNVGGRESILLRNRHDAILNMCRILRLNLEKQLEKIAPLLALTTDANVHYLKELQRLARTLNVSLEKVIVHLEDIVRNSNQMILLDNLIQTAKKYQRTTISRLKKLTITALNDAENAIAGSQMNYDRGAGLAAEMEKIPAYVDQENLFALYGIVDMSTEGAELARHVHESSHSQLEFAKKVNSVTSQLHNESRYIQSLVSEKYELFTHNVERISEVAAVVAVEFFEYLSAGDVSRHLKQKGDSESLDQVYELLAYIENACSDIESVANLNYDMTEAISANSKIEERTMELTTDETNAFEKTKMQVIYMTEDTRFPIEGSARNIENGEKLRDLVSSVVDRLKNS